MIPPFLGKDERWMTISGRCGNGSRRWSGAKAGVQKGVPRPLAETAALTRGSAAGAGCRAAARTSSSTYSVRRATMASTTRRSPPRTPTESGDRRSEPIPRPASCPKCPRNPRKRPLSPRETAAHRCVTQLLHARRTSARRASAPSPLPDDMASRDRREEASGTFCYDARRAWESRHSTPFFPLSRHGPARSSKTAESADRAAL